MSMIKAASAAEAAFVQPRDSKYSQTGSISASRFPSQKQVIGRTSVVVVFSARLLPGPTEFLQSSTLSGDDGDAVAAAPAGALAPTPATEQDEHGGHTGQGGHDVGVEKGTGKEDSRQSSSERTEDKEDA